MRYVTALMVMLSILSQPLQANQDANGSQDYPGIGRLEGSYIKAYKDVGFDEYNIVISPIKTNEDPKKHTTLEGKVTRIAYWAPQSVSVLEAQRNYENRLKDIGFELLYTCNSDECGGRMFTDVIDQYIMLWPVFRYAVAKKTTDTKEVYATVVTTIDGSNIPKTQIAVIETQAMVNKMIDASVMAESIGEEGRIALYGILFDVDRAVIRPESKPTLEQISTLLGNNPKLKIVIVGHTDNQGELAYNRDLSTRRAKSVETALVSDYGISKDRLSAWGVGYLSPVASNQSEAGRAKNRRVELVEN